MEGATADKEALEMMAEVDVEGRNALIGRAEAVSEALACDGRCNSHSSGQDDACRMSRRHTCARLGLIALFCQCLENQVFEA